MACAAPCIPSNAAVAAQASAGIFFHSLQPSDSQVMYFPKGLHAVLLQLLPQYVTPGNLEDAASNLENTDSYNNIGLPELHPELIQAALLTHVQKHELQRRPDVGKDAVASCVQWFVATVSNTMHLRLDEANAISDKVISAAHT